MNLITYKNGILVACPQVVCENGLKYESVIRINHLSNIRFVAAINGCINNGEEFVRWADQTSGNFNTPKPDFSTEEFSVVIIWDHNNKDKRSWILCEYRNGHSVPAIKLKEDSVYAIGSGMDYSYGAMYSGLSASEAIHIATKISKENGFMLEEYNVFEHKWINALFPGNYKILQNPDKNKKKIKGKK